MRPTPSPMGCQDISLSDYVFRSPVGIGPPRTAIDGVFFVLITAGLRSVGTVADKVGREQLVYQANVAFIKSFFISRW